jgi:hypothetical protein
MRGLQVHPEFRGVPEILRQEQRGFRRNSTLSPNQLVHAVGRNFERAGKMGLAQPQGLKKLLEQHSPWMRGNAMSRQHSRLSVVICAAHLQAIPGRKLKYDTILVIYTNTVQPGQVASEPFQSISRRDEKILKARGCVQEIELYLNSAPQVLRQASSRLRISSVVDVLRRRVSKRDAHSSSIHGTTVFMYQLKRGSLNPMKTNERAESTSIADQLRRAFDGGAWHGPALLELLKDVNAATAAAKPLAERPQHLGTRSARRRLGRRGAPPPGRTKSSALGCAEFPSRSQAHRDCLAESAR